MLFRTKKGEEEREGVKNTDNEKEHTHYALNTKMDEEEELLKYKCLKAILGKSSLLVLLPFLFFFSTKSIFLANGDKAGKDEVHIQKLGEFLNWFGPLRPETSAVVDKHPPFNKPVTILDCVRERLSHLYVLPFSPVLNSYNLFLFVVDGSMGISQERRHKGG